MDGSQEWPAMVTFLKPRRRSLHMTITPAFSLSLVLFGLVALLAYKSSNRLIAGEERVAEANEVLARLATASTYLERAEMEAASFVLAGDSPHRQRMTVDAKEAQDGLHGLRDLIADNPTQQDSLTRLETLVKAESDRLAKAIERRGENGDTAVVLATDQATQNMKTIRDLFEQMRSEETFLLHQRTAKAQAEAGNRIWAFGGMAVAVLLGMALSYALVLEFESHVRRGEKDLQEAKLAAETANQTKSTFLASMSHEIRTPMTAIIGFADLLLRPNLSDHDRLRYVDTVRRQGQHLLSLVNDILDLSKIEAGKMEVEKIACPPIQVINDVINLLRPRATEKQVSLDAQYVGPCPELIKSDPTRLRQILTNLVANAIKFTDRGSIRLFVQLAPSADGVSRLQFRITDTGAGMSPDQVKALFQPFKQADKSTTRKYGGTGLGLVIAKQFAQMLGGDVSVASQLGAGSTFVVEIATGPLEGTRLIERPQDQPRAKIDPPKEVVGSSSRFSGRILLAEDSLTNQQLISLYLKEAGAEVSVAENGRVACDMVNAAAKSRLPFHLVLMDMEMPEMDGCEATKQLRNDGHKLPIIALTANAMSADRDQCLTSGCNAFATKPIDWPRVLDLIGGYLRNKDVSQSRPEDPHLAIVLKTFMVELEQVEKNLRAAVAANDRERLGKLSHALKGTAGNCGFSTLSEVANDAAHAAKGTATPEVVNRNIQALIELIGHTRLQRAA